MPRTSTATVVALSTALVPAPATDAQYALQQLSHPRYSLDGQRNSCFVKMSDGNLICINQYGDRWLEFAKTSSGYGEAGLTAEAATVGIGVDYSVANIYHALKPIEALALMDYDWKVFYQAAKEARARDPESVDPELVERVLRPYVEPMEEPVPATSQRPNATEQPKSLEALSLATAQFETWPLLPESDRHRGTIPEPVYIRLDVDGDVLLKASEIRGRLYLSKTSGGYGVFGLRFSAATFGGGFEIPVGNLYFPVGVEEARAYMDGNWGRLYERAVAQAKVLPNSVSPELIRRTFESPPADSDPLFRDFIKLTIDSPVWDSASDEMHARPRRQE